MFNLDRLKQLAEQAVVLASGAVQQAENAIGDAVRESPPTPASDVSALDATAVSEHKAQADQSIELHSGDLEELPDKAEQPQQGDEVVIKCQEDTSKAQDVPKSEDTLRAEKAEALARRLAHAFKMQKLQLEKQTLLLEKLTIDCARLAEEKRSAEETALQEQKEAHVMLVSAKDEQINTLLKEGEQLSKKHGMLIESVRRLRKDLSERDQELTEAKARPSAQLAGDNFQAAVLTALTVLQQRQVQFHTESQQQFSQLTVGVHSHALPPPAGSAGNESPSILSSDCPKVAEVTNPLTLAAQSSSLLELSNVDPDESVSHDSTDTAAEVVSVADTNERVDPPDDIDDEMYNLAYPKSHE